MPEFPCPAPVTVAARLGGGELRVTAEPRDTAVVEVSPWDGSDAAREAADRTQVDLRGGRLLIEAPEAGTGWLLRRGTRVRVDVRVPLDCSLNLRVASAEVYCRGRYADAGVHTASGDIAVEYVTGNATIHTASGNILVDRVDGRSSVNAASGDVTMTLAGGDVTAHTASGDVTVDEAGGSVKVNTASGAVRIGCVRHGVTRLKAASGDMSVGIAQGTRVWLDVATASGRTLSDLDVTASAAGGQPDLTLALRTASGDIDIHRVAMPAAA
jgi:DUF4097 and DUF4098 domain-containing protein YvlB